MENKELSLLENYGLLDLNSQLLNEEEQKLLKESADLFQKGYPKYAVIALWNAAVSNLRRRAETIGIEYFFSDETNNKYNSTGTTLDERWRNIKDYDLIERCYSVGIVSPKGRDTLKTILSMRNSFSGAHYSSCEINENDLLAYVLLLVSNLFSLDFPKPVINFKALRETIENNLLNENSIDYLKSNIESYEPRMIVTLLGYFKDKLAEGKEPALANIKNLFSSIWEKADDPLRTSFAKSIADYQNGIISDKSDDHGAESRLYEMLLTVRGVRYLSEDFRKKIYEKLITNLARAKNTFYGWGLEVQAAKALAQVSYEAIPKSIFKELYACILAVLCGNGWGRSGAKEYLEDFIFQLPAKKRVEVAQLFCTSSFARNELYLPLPKKNALELLDRIKNSLTNESQKMIVLEIEKSVKEIGK